ncbi:unnamed protein product [Rhizoctonia solani]|uniref:BTB domain-containing protein n=1 Tax=Rhizoctonia solani TaxID=456999 RepID=A0A8H3HRM3_9AGAM|nr:unnamed protein product [Rhizoctonia solani]
MSSESPKSAPAQRIPAFVGATASFFDDEPTISFGNNKRTDTDPAVNDGIEPAPVHPEFAFSDGNIQLQTINQTFWVHEYHLNKFAVFAALIQAAKSSGTVSDVDRRIVVTCDKTTNGEDIYNTLKVIYASHIDGVPDFDSSTLTSTLRISTSFDYPALRNFAISKLEGMDIPAIQRIQLSDEFSLPSWETPAFTELCSRKEPITHAEAEILGMSRFVEIARIRETERTRLAVKFAGGVYEELLEASGLASPLQPENPGGTGSAQNTFEYSSGRSVLPACNCYVDRSRYDASYKVVHCSLHQVAPEVLKEGQSLLKERDDLLGRFGKIRSSINSRLEHGNPLSKLDGLDLKTELSRASWIRRECTVAS